jgi:hypothetical protein
MTEDSNIQIVLQYGWNHEKRKKNDCMITYKVWWWGVNVLCFISAIFHCPELTHMAPESTCGLMGSRRYSLLLCQRGWIGFVEGPFPTHHHHHSHPSLFLSSVFFFFDRSRVWSQSLVLASQLFCHLSHSPVLLITFQ